MTEMTKEQRKTFLENQGRMTAGTGYYRDADAGFKAMAEFKPFAGFDFEFRKDFADFARGFNEVQDLRVLVMLLKAKAQAENTLLLKELEGRGLTFLQNKVK